MPPIIIINWNGYKDTCECLDSFLSFYRSKVFLIDNGSDNDEGIKLQQRYRDNVNIKIILNKDNPGFTKGNNQILTTLLSKEKFEYIALLNNDTVVDPEWLTNLYKQALEKKADLVSSKMINYNDKNKIDNTGHLFLNTGEALPRSTGEMANQNVNGSNWGPCAGACLYSTKMLRAIGLFDEFFTTGYEDAELGLRAILAGYKSIYAPDAVVYHKGGVSIDKIRDLEYAIKLHENILYTYFKLMPWPVILVNAPFILIKYAGITLIALLTLRIRLLKVVYVSTWRLLTRDRKILLKARKDFAPLRKLTSWQILRKQTFFLKYYWKYFSNYVLKNKKTVFEK